ncbi:MAG TPA: M23 family metallopeptidase [Mariprofundaceae bacterium]|nr:M23 family metallopeptidase [Mariprofundaceae bacterium]
MRRLERLLPVILMLLALPLSAQAGSGDSGWTAVQGQVIEIDTDALPPGAVRLKAFGRLWPVKRQKDGALRAWIGVDLDQKPGRYPLTWIIGEGAKPERRTDRLTVTAGSFRISRITVAKKMAEFDAPTLARIRADQHALMHTYSMPVKAAPDIRMQAWPVSGEISTPFGARRYVNGEPRSPHSGIDIAVPTGTPVHAPLAGRVLLVSNMYLDGTTVVLGHGNGLVSVYCHLSHTDVKKGDWLKTGDVIGESGMTGRATGPHLHWGVRFEKARVDPESLLPPADAAVAAGGLR